MRRFVALLGLAALLFVLSAPAAGADPGHEADFVARVNALRATKGIAPLLVDAQMTSVARSWSAQMAASNTLSHNPNFSSQISNWKLVGENVGTGPDVAVIEQAFENSPHHYANLVNPAYNFIGVGVVEANGTLWVTQNFKQARTVAAAPSAAPAKPAPAPAPAPKAAAAPKPAAPKPAAAPAPEPAPAPVAAPSTVPAPPVPVPAPATEVAGVVAERPTPAGAPAPARTATPVGVALVAAALLLAVGGAVVRHRPLLGR
jgi:hypothetical protein